MAAALLTSREPESLRGSDAGISSERERGSAERSEWPMRPGGTTNTYLQIHKAKIKSNIKKYELLNVRHRIKS